MADPARIRAEWAVIGGVLIDPDALGGVRAVIGASDFSGPRARAVFSAACDLADRGAVVDYLTVVLELERTGLLARVGEHRLTEAINLCPTSLHVVDYAAALAALGEVAIDPTVGKGLVI